MPAASKNQCAFPFVEFGEKKQKFWEFEAIRNALSLRVLAHELDWILIRPLVAHHVTEKALISFSNLSSCCF